MGASLLSPCTALRIKSLGRNMEGKEQGGHTGWDFRDTGLPIQIQLNWDVPFCSCPSAHALSWTHPSAHDHPSRQPSLTGSPLNGHTPLQCSLPMSVLLGYTGGMDLHFLKPQQGPEIL